MGGHVRSIPEINSSNKVVRQAAERMAVNSVIQGTAAEIVKLAMIAIDGELSKQNLKSKLILQVHDEVILEVPSNELEKVSTLIKDCMINAVKLSIPLRVSVENGRTWGEMH
jgi:DNA polymerase-1